MCRHRSHGLPLRYRRGRAHLAGGGRRSRRGTNLTRHVQYAASGGPSTSRRRATTNTPRRARGRQLLDGKCQHRREAVDVGGENEQRGPPAGRDQAERQPGHGRQWPRRNRGSASAPATITTTGVACQTARRAHSSRYMVVSNCVGQIASKPNRTSVTAQPPAKPRTLIGTQTRARSEVVPARDLGDDGEPRVTDRRVVRAKTGYVTFLNVTVRRLVVNPPARFCEALVDAIVESAIKVFHYVADGSLDVHPYR